MPERCINLGGLHLCRRCSLLWPITYLLLALQALLSSSGSSPMDLALPLLLAPPLGEYVLVALDRLHYSARRVWLFTPLAGMALARLLYRHMVSPWDAWAWSILATGAVVALWVTWHQHKKKVRLELPPQLSHPLLQGHDSSPTEKRSYHSSENQSESEKLSS